MNKYMVVRNGNLTQLELMVDLNMDINGWTPIGGVTAIVDDDGNETGFIFMQAMIKSNE